MSSILRADTDQMRATVQKLQQGSQALQENFERARQAMSAMQNSPWSGQNRVMAENYWQTLQARFAPSFETIEDIASRLLRTAEAYDEAAQVFAEGEFKATATAAAHGATTGAESASAGASSKAPGTETHATEPGASASEPSSPAESQPPASSSTTQDDVFAKYTGDTYDPQTNQKPWIPIDAPVQGKPGDRDPRLYEAAINQFGVENNPRYTAYQQGKGDTYCNIFMWDVTRSMGAEIPHWVDAQGNPGVVGQGNRELDANSSINWLQQHGPQHGWQAVDATTAQAMANQGHPVVATMHNPGGIGHVAMVRPGEYSPDQGPAIAQAGAHNMNNTHVINGFGRLDKIVYYVSE